MLRTVKAECARPPEADMAAQQARLDGWRREFNEDRPHEALGYEVPASLYVRSPRSMPTVLPEPEYPGHAEVRQVSRCGTFKFKGRQRFLSQTLAGEQVAFEETADGVWDVYSFDRLLARLDERTWRLTA